MRRHPNRKRLAAWLDGLEVDEALDEHLDTCERCAATIEELAAQDDPVQNALQRVLAPPDDLQQRIESGIGARLQNRQDVSLVAELMGIGLGTARVVFGRVEPHAADPQPEDPSRENEEDVEDEADEEDEVEGRGLPTPPEDDS